jgi:hypothetical protein
MTHARDRALRVHAQACRGRGEGRIGEYIVRLVQYLGDMI